MYAQIAVPIIYMEGNFADTLTVNTVLITKHNMK